LIFHNLLKLLYFLTLSLSCFYVFSADQNYPSRSIKLVIPYPPGGGIDPAGRIIAYALTQQLGQQVFTENISGASGQIGTANVARSKADGYTLLFGSVAPNAILPAAYGTQLLYDGKKSFIPIAKVAESNYVLLVNKTIPVNSLEEFIKYAQANPGKISYSSSGVLSGPHLAGELLAKMANLELIHVPYKGNGPSFTGFLGGDVNITFDSAGGVVGKKQDEKFRVIAITGSPVLPALASIPNLSKIYPNHNVFQWYGLFAVQNTPDEVVSRLSIAMDNIMKNPEMKKKINDMGLIPAVESNSNYFQLFVNEEIDRWKQVFSNYRFDIPVLR
jgi:tripartite-type tricarboxylate transporter receptor subunit TctC